MTIELNNFDVLAYTLIGISIIVGLFKGVTKSIIWLLAIVGSIYSIINFRVAVAQKLTPYVDSDVLRVIIAILIIIFLFMLTGTILTKVVRSLISAIGLSGVDHLFGGIFGFMRGYLILAILTNLISYSDQLLELLETKSSSTWPSVKQYSDKTKLDLTRQISSLSDLGTYLRKQLDHFVSLNNTHAPKHHK